MSDFTQLEKLSGYIALRWDEPDAQQGAYEYLQTIPSKDKKQQNLKSAIAWYCKPKQWGNVEYFDVVLGLLNDWHSGEIHIESNGEPEYTHIKEKDLAGHVVFLQAGHTASGKGSGYYAPHAKYEKDEHKFAKKVLEKAIKNLEERGCEVHTWDRTEGSFGEHSRRTRKLMDKFCPNAELALQFHWNCASPSAHGHECIVASESGAKLGRKISKRMKERFPWSTARHGDGVVKKSSGRGTAWLKKVKPPACFTELFFASNKEELAKVETAKGVEGLAWVIEQGCADFLLS